MNIDNRLTAPPDALGALYFLPGQYLFKRIESGRESAKALSSEQISLAFRETRCDSGWITRRILRYREEPEGNFVLSYEPAGIRTIFIEHRNGSVVETKLPLPTLILLGKGNEYYLWAAKGRRLITIKTNLAISPLPNIGGDLSGKICFGKNEVPEAKINCIDEIWNLIFNTPFNGDHSANKCRSEAKDVRKLLASLAKRKAKTFPASELLESNTTIEDMWLRVVENRYFPNL